MATATLASNNAETGAEDIGERGGVLEIRGVSGTITITLHRSIDGGRNYAPSDESFNANVSMDIVGKGKFKAVASGVSGGSAVVTVHRH